MDSVALNLRSIPRANAYDHSRAPVMGLMERRHDMSHHEGGMGMDKAMAAGKTTAKKASKPAAKPAAKPATKKK